MSRADFCRRSLNLIRTPSRRVAACVRGGAQGVSWSATYLHPNIKPLRLVPIILDKRQDSMMYCRGAYRVSPVRRFSRYGPSCLCAARRNLKNRHGVSGRKPLLSIMILLSVHGERWKLLISLWIIIVIVIITIRGNKCRLIVRFHQKRSDWNLLDSTDDSTERYIVETDIRVIMWLLDSIVLLIPILSI